MKTLRHEKEEKIKKKSMFFTSHTEKLGSQKEPLLLDFSLLLSNLIPIGLEAD